MNTEEKKNRQPTVKHCRDCYEYQSHDGGFSGWCPVIKCAVFGACTCTASDYLTLGEGDQLSIF